MATTAPRCSPRTRTFTSDPAPPPALAPAVTRSTADPKPHTRRANLTDEQRKAALSASLAVESFTADEVRCAYCGKSIKTDKRSGAFSCPNFKRHLQRVHAGAVHPLIVGQKCELSVRGLTSRRKDSASKRNAGGRNSKQGGGVRAHNNAPRISSYVLAQSLVEVDRARMRSPGADPRLIGKENLYLLAFVSDAAKPQ
ncbi:hypothetical protein HDZ31DRAFT_43113 [Schizophyllum fasciatum]